MKKNVLLIGLLAGIWGMAITANAQQIGNGAATVIESFNAVLPSGIYTSNNAQPNYPQEVSAWPWKYLIAAKYGTCEFQISSTFSQDGRAFFRKVVNDSNNPGCNNSWYEFATRGENAFTDNQFLPFSKKLIMGSRTSVTRQLSLQFIGNETQGDCYIDYGGSLYFRGSSGSEYGYPVIAFRPDGNVCIGLENSTIKKLLIVYGTIAAEEVRVKSNVWADHVFREDYRLKPLAEVNTFIKENKHLPEIPSATEIEANEGVNLGEMQVKLLQKIEELTLYLIEQDNTIKGLKDKIEKLENK